MNTYEQRESAAPLETFEWDSVWMEHTEDRASPRLLYIGDSISIPTRGHMNALLRGAARVDGFATSKAADNPCYAKAVRLFAGQQTAPVRAVLFNNGLHGWHLDDFDAYPRHYERMVTQLSALFPKASFILVLTTPVGDTALDARVQERNKAAIQTAKTHGLKTIDLYHAAPSLPSYLSADTVHFTDEGYEILAKTVADVLKQQL